MKRYNLPEFIESILIPDRDKMLTHQLHYYAFSLKTLINSASERLRTDVRLISLFRGGEKSDRRP